MIQRLEEAQKTLVIRDLEDVLTEAHIFGVKHPQLEYHGAWVRFLWSNLFCNTCFRNRITSHSRSSIGNSRGNLDGNRILYLNRLVHAYSTKHWPDYFRLEYQNTKSYHLEWLSKRKRRPIGSNEAANETDDTRQPGKMQSTKPEQNEACLI